MTAIDPHRLSSATTRPTGWLASGGFMGAALDAEWATLSTSGTARRTYRAWLPAHPALRPAGSPAGVVDLIRTGEQQASIAASWALFDLIAAGDALAARTMLQVILPAMISEAGGWLRDLHSRNGPGGRPELTLAETEQLVMAEAIQAIADVARSRRGAWPIATVVRRLHRLLVRQVRMQRRWTSHNRLDTAGRDDTTRPTGELGDRTDPVVESRVGDDPAERHAAIELAALLVEEVAAGTINEDEGQMVWMTRIGGYRPADVADHYGLSPDTFRRRRHRIEARLVATAAPRNRAVAV